MNNRGSTTVELSLIAPIMVGIVYLYLLYFVSLIGWCQTEWKEVQQMYCVNEELEVQDSNLEKTECEIKTQNGILGYRIIYRKTRDDIVKKIRRWQLEISTLS